MSLSVFPANRGVLRLLNEAQVEEASEYFQYSLRIVGFCDEWELHVTFPSWNLSVFPANRGVLRQKRPARGSAW